MYPLFVADKHGESIKDFVEEASGRIPRMALLTPKKAIWLQQEGPKNPEEVFRYYENVMYDTQIQTYISDAIPSQIFGIQTLVKDIYQSDTLVLTDNISLLGPEKSKYLYAKLGDFKEGENAEFSAQKGELVDYLHAYERLKQ